MNLFKSVSDTVNDFAMRKYSLLSEKELYNSLNALLEKWASEPVDAAELNKADKIVDEPIQPADGYLSKTMFNPGEIENDPDPAMPPDTTVELNTWPREMDIAAEAFQLFTQLFNSTVFTPRVNYDLLMVLREKIHEELEKVIHWTQKLEK